MRRIIFLAGTFVLGLAALMWVTAPISAYPGGAGGRGGGNAGARGGGAPVGGGHAVARTGSIHYASRAGRDPVGPGVRPVQAVGGVHRNPYQSQYSRHFRPGFRPIILGDAQYYIYDSLPGGCQTVLGNGVTYDLCDGVYYQPYFYGGQTVYLVVPSPT
jgi:hypothetical protein